MKRFQTENYYGEINLDENKGWFEHERYGDEIGGELWFNEDKEMVDYDGVFALPNEVIKAIRELGFFVEKEFEG